MQNNKPKLIDYEFITKKYNFFEDFPKGLKGHFSNNDDEELIVF